MDKLKEVFILPRLFNVNKDRPTKILTFG
jgi:hypothetical protein